MLRTFLNQIDSEVVILIENTTTSNDFKKNAFYLQKIIIFLKINIHNVQLSRNLIL